MLGPDYYPLNEHPHVRISKPLTGKGAFSVSLLYARILMIYPSTAWDKIQADVVAFLQQRKDARLRDQRRKLISDRVNSLKTAITAARTAPPKRTIENEYKPRFEEIALMPEIRELLLAPNDVVLDPLTLSEIVHPMLPALEERWRSENTERLRALLDDNETPEGIDVFDLARSLFRCKECDRRMYYPVVLSHQCDHINYIKLSREAKSEEEYYSKAVLLVVFASHAWDIGHIERAPNPHMIDAALALCG